MKEYLIEFYDAETDNTDYMTIFAYNVHQATKIFYMTTSGKYITYVDSINRK